MSTKYVQKQHDVYRITDTRVSLDSIVYARWAGQSAETIAQSFQVLTLEQVYGAIAFYLAHREEIDGYLEQQRVEYEAKAAGRTRCGSDVLPEDGRSAPSIAHRPMKVRFQADADLHQMIVTALVRCEPGVDFQTATAAGLAGLRDPHVLERAATAGRVLVSHAQSTMPQHVAEGIGNPKAFFAPSPRQPAAAARRKAERGLDMLRIGEGGASRVPGGDGLGKGG